MSGPPLKALIPVQIDGSLDDAMLTSPTNKVGPVKGLKYAVPIQSEESP